MPLPSTAVHRRLAGAVIACLVLLAACSGGGGRASSTTTSVPTSTTGGVKFAAGVACERLTAADATRFFGEPATVVVPSSARPAGAASACFYDVTGASGQLLQFRIYANEQYYARTEHPDAQDVAGLGERGFVSRAGPGGLVDVQFVKQATVYSLSYSNATGTAAAKADALVALARDVAGRV